MTQNDKKDVAVLDRTLYAENICSQLETPDNIGRMVIIGVETGDFEIGDEDGIEAAHRLREKHPGGRLFGVQIRYNVAESFGQRQERKFMNYRDYITIEPNKRGGKPCVRGLRVTVYEVLEYLASEMTEQEILEDFPDLTREDLKACLAYAADRERRFMMSPIAA